MADENKRDEKTQQQQSEKKHAVDDTNHDNMQEAIEDPESAEFHHEDYVERITEKTSKH